jgi:hypothetical protein
MLSCLAPTVLIESSCFAVGWCLVSERVLLVDRATDGVVVRAFKGR